MVCLEFASFEMVPGIPGRREVARDADGTRWPCTDHGQSWGAALCDVLILLDPLLYFLEDSLITILQWKTYLMIFFPLKFKVDYSFKF